MDFSKVAAADLCQGLLHESMGSERQAACFFVASALYRNTDERCFVFALRVRPCARTWLTART